MSGRRRRSGIGEWMGLIGRGVSGWIARDWRRLPLAGRTKERWEFQQRKRFVSRSFASMVSWTDAVGSDRSLRRGCTSKLVRRRTKRIIAFVRIALEQSHNGKPVTIHCTSLPSLVLPATDELETEHCIEGKLA